MNINKVVLCGRVGKSIEAKQVTAEFKTASFTLATSEKWKDKQGEQKEETTWHNLQASNRQADVLEKYVSKGDLLYVEGRLKNRSYEKDGVKQYITFVQVDSVQLFPKKEGANLAQSERQQSNEPDDSGDLPF